MVAAKRKRSPPREKAPETSSAAISTGPGQALAESLRPLMRRKCLTPTALRLTRRGRLSLAAGMASGSRSPTPKNSLQHPLFRISYTDFVEDVLGGEIGSVRNVATPQLMRYKQGGNKLSHRDTIIDVCDIWPVCSEDDRNTADGGDLQRRGVTDGILGSDASCPLSMCVDPRTFSSSQQDCAWRKSRVGFTYLTDGSENDARKRDADTYGDLSVQLPRPASTEWLLPGRYCGLDTLCSSRLNDLHWAQCMKGMVYQNHMINVGPTAKIFDRCGDSSLALRGGS